MINQICLEENHVLCKVVSGPNHFLKVDNIDLVTATCREIGQALLRRKQHLKQNGPLPKPRTLAVPVSQKRKCKVSVGESYRWSKMDKQNRAWVRLITKFLSSYWNVMKNSWSSTMLLEGSSYVIFHFVNLCETESGVILGNRSRLLWITAPFPP